jgi:hypothetical protein
MKKQHQEKEQDRPVFCLFGGVTFTICLAVSTEDTSDPPNGEFFVSSNASSPEWRWRFLPDRGDDLDSAT